jgi:hypothetical protein
MKKSRIRKELEPTTGISHLRSQQGAELAAAEPDMLRDSVQKGLSELSEEDRPRVYDRLVTALNKAGVNLGQLLLVLGIPARTAAELTAPEIATLVRYVRLNEPAAMVALATVLSEFVTTNAEAGRAAKVSRRAA